MTLHIPAKVLQYTCGHNTFYYMTLSTGKQQPHMTNYFIINQSWVSNLQQCRQLQSKVTSLGYCRTGEIQINGET